MNTTVIQDGKIIDGTGKPVINEGVIIVENGKIKAVGEKNHIEIPKGENVKTITAKNKTVLPGLIDSHVHIYSQGESGDFRSLPIYNNYIDLALKSVPRLKRTLHMGITSLRDGGDGWGWLEVALREAIKRGDILGPTFFATGYHITVSGGHGYYLPPWLSDNPVWGYQASVHADGPVEWRKAARINIHNGVDNIKVVASRDIISPGIATAPQATLEELTAAIEEAHKMGKKALAHAQGPVAIKNVIKAGADSVVHGFFIDEECAELMAKNDVYLEGTNYYAKVILEKGSGDLPDWMVQKAQETWDDRKKNFKMLLDLGIKMPFASDAGVPYILQGDNANELRMFVELGMTPMQAIVSATKISAEAIGIESTVGTLEKGKNADIIIVDGDPLKDITVLGMEEKIKLVMKDGEIVITR